MMPDASERFPYVERSLQSGISGRMPYIPLTLSYHDTSLNSFGLLDTGATVNVLPYELGLQLGGHWDQQRVKLELSGNLSRVEARALAVHVKLGSFSPVLLGFAWTRSNEAPLLLGQVNFLAEFNVCFFRSQGYVEIRSTKG